ncbi:MAG: hypothetical protein WCN95_10805, partial [bacterium]
IRIFLILAPSPPQRASLCTLSRRNTSFQVKLCGLRTHSVHLFVRPFFNQSQEFLNVFTVADNCSNDG